MGKTTFCCSLHSAILRTRGTTKTKTTLPTKQVFGVFCFQEQKTILENIKQTGPKTFFSTLLFDLGATNSKFFSDKFKPSSL